MKRFLVYGFFAAFLSVFAGRLPAQSNSAFAVSGYLEYLNNTWAPEKSARWSNVSGAYNRVNFYWYPSADLTLSAGIRNNFYFGPMMADLYPFYSDFLEKDYGFADMTLRWARDTSYLFLTNIDRLNLKWTFRKFELTVGRQRINWGLNMIWNPNDIFNTYNFFDFDYAERPGSDAVLAQFYTGDFSSLQLAAKLNSGKKLTLAALYKFHLFHYDFQLLAGVMDDDVTAGAGWDGQIGGAGFTGEVSCFRNKERFADTTGQWVASAGINYTFSNGLFLNGSFIFNSKGTTGPASMGALFFSGTLTPKTLTLSKFDLFAQVSYPVTPIVKADLSSIINPNDGSFFAGPSLDFSLTENLDFLLMGQLFFGKDRTEFGDYGQMYYVRIKWAF